MRATSSILEEEEGRVRDSATDILIEADAIRECDEHEGYYFVGGSDVEDACKVANARITTGDIIVRDRRAFINIIEDVYEERSGAKVCTRCARDYGPGGT